MRHARRIGAGAVAAAMMVALVLAATGPADAKPPRQCADDIKRFCADIPKGGGRINACLHEHLPKLAPACAGALEESRERTKQKRRFRRMPPLWADPCRSDVEKLCRSIPLGPGRIAECLSQHLGEVSIACRAAFTATPTP